MVIMGIVAATAVWGLTTYARTQQLSATAEGVLGALRTAATQAHAEGRTYCVQFDAGGKSWAVWQYSCDKNEPTTPGTPTKVSTGKAEGVGQVSSVALTAPTGPSFAHGCPAGPNQCAYFYPRGVAADGAVTVTRPGSSSTYTIHVVGLTGRVFMDH